MTNDVHLMPDALVTVYPDLAMVRIKVAVQSDDREPIPAGSTGAIVGS